MKYIKLFEELFGKPAEESIEGSMNLLTIDKVDPDRPKVLYDIFKLVNKYDSSLLDECQYEISGSSIQITMPKEETLIKNIINFLHNTKDDSGQKYVFIPKYFTDRYNNVWYKLKIVR
jgi:hypothetical protein